MRRADRAGPPSSLEMSQGRKAEDSDTGEEAGASTARSGEPKSCSSVSDEVALQHPQKV